MMVPLLVVMTILSTFSSLLDVCEGEEGVCVWGWGREGVGGGGCGGFLGCCCYPYYHYVCVSARGEVREEGTGRGDSQQQFVSFPLFYTRSD